MNTPDQPTRPTEAHYQLAHIIRQSSTQERAAQLIADSQARAIGRQVEALAILTLRWDKVEKERNQLRARAEKAEAAETVALSRWNGALERAMKAEAELATERARFDSGQIMLTVAGERVWHCGIDLRAAIDAGVKEGAK